MSITAFTPFQPRADLALLDHIEATGEVYRSWEVLELVKQLEQQAQEEREAQERERQQQAQQEQVQQTLAQKAMHQDDADYKSASIIEVDHDRSQSMEPAIIVGHEQKIKKLRADLKQACQSLQQALVPLRTAPEVEFSATSVEVQQYTEVIHQAIAPLLNLTYQYRDLLAATDRRDSITHFYYQRGLTYCSNYLIHRATLTALTAELNSVLRPNITLERIYRYLEQLPSLHYALGDRLLQALWEQVLDSEPTPPEDKPSFNPSAAPESLESPTQEEL